MMHKVPSRLHRSGDFMSRKEHIISHPRSKVFQKQLTRKKKEEKNQEAKGKKIFAYPKIIIRFRNNFFIKDIFPATSFVHTLSVEIKSGAISYTN